MKFNWKHLLVGAAVTIGIIFVIKKGGASGKSGALSSFANSI